MEQSRDCCALDGITPESSFHDVHFELRIPFDLPLFFEATAPFATLPYYRTRAERIRRRLIIVGVLGFFLIGIPLGLWAVDTYVMPLQQLLDTILKRVGLAGLLSDVSSALV